MPATLAIIGTRGHHAMVLRNLPPENQLIAASPGGDSISAVLDWCSKSSRTHPKVFEDWRAMLDEAKPTALIVCGPFETHVQMCIAAIERGIHVLTEKPAALTMDELSQLRAACEKRPDIHLVGMMQSRYDAGFSAARDLIATGAIGDVRLIDTRKSYKLGRRAAYYHQRETYGGTIPWVGSHAIDWIYFFATAAGIAKPFRSVFASHTSQPAGENGTMERTAACHFTLDGGRIATVSIDVMRPETAKTHGDDWARIVGTRGVIEARPDQLSLLNDEHDGPMQIAPPADNLTKDFLEQIAGKRRGSASTEDTLLVTEACLLARDSADQKRTLSF